ncbi:glycosyltransferase family 4 protein [Nonomuraea sp. NEAU-A123]|uniref:glycosyltransferase family 4 protein n=1 Tax=Nonomuraea sp. NEAU-A123 TaxID=2839649 RepID=UPI001BE3D7F3|nr:glycosyltransferase family 4 protein [Nonomuraea sp. NEAU-A123]MBT2234555.1 glycosyltransferase family 4 protein [Nonomuraea sp. NEAU-A123]
MKIRYLLLHAYGQGGTIRTVITQANAMAALGHEVEIASAVRRKDKPRFHVDPRVTLVPLADQRDGVPADSLGRKLWRRMRGKIVPFGEFAADYFTERVEKAVIDYVSGLEGGILVTTRPALNLISARRTPKSVICVAQDHMNLGAYPDTIKREIARYYGRFDAIVVLTKTNQVEYRILLPGTPIVRIPNAVHATGQVSKQVNPVVVAAGRLVKQKGFDLLIPAFQKAAERHPDWRLRVYGGGPRKAELGALISELGLEDRVQLMGRTDRMDEKLAGASIYALSSRFEGLPMVMIEAMGHGLPVAAFDCPTGPADVLTSGKDGLLVPSEDIGGLARALDRLMSDKALRLRMGAAARRTAGNYEADSVMPLWEDLFAELLSREPINDSYWTR